MDRSTNQTTPPASASSDVSGRAVSSTRWWETLPTLVGRRVTLREVRASDADALVAALTHEDVSRFIWPPPITRDAFRRFILWAHMHRRAGTYACFAVTVDGKDTAVGIFQLRELEPGFATAEWGFAIDAKHWGTGVFQEGADLVMEFAFDTVNVRRLEARAAVQNERGNGALRKLGAVKEALLRRSFVRRDEYLDEYLWTILPEDRLEAKVIWGGTSPLQ